MGGNDRVLVELSKTNLMGKNQLGDNVVLSWVVVCKAGVSSSGLHVCMPGKCFTIELHTQPNLEPF